MQPASAAASRRRTAWRRGAGSTPTMAIGNSSPVSTTMNSEMPSTPRCQEMPRTLIQRAGRRRTGSPTRAVLNRAAGADGQRAGGRRRTATRRGVASSGAARGTATVTTAPTSGRRMATVREQRRWTARGLAARVEVSIRRHPGEDVGEDDDGAGGDAEGVVAHVAASGGPGAAAAAAHRGGDAVDRAVDDLRGRTRRWPRTPAAGAAHERARWPRR